MFQDLENSRIAAAACRIAGTSCASSSITLDNITLRFLTQTAI